MDDDNKRGKIHAHPLPLRSRRRTTMGRNLRKAGLSEGAFHLVKGFGSRVRITSKELAQIHRVILGMLPCARKIKHRQAEGSANKVLVSTQRKERIVSIRKQHRRVEERAQWPWQRASNSRIVLLRILCRDISNFFPLARSFHTVLTDIVRGI